jgi:hypothetical protein
LIPSTSPPMVPPALPPISTVRLRDEPLSEGAVLPLRRRRRARATARAP